MEKYKKEIHSILTNLGHYQTKSEDNYLEYKSNGKGALNTQSRDIFKHYIFTKE